MPDSERRPIHPARLAKRRFGQHFLEPAWVAKVVAAMDPAASDTFVEIGPGAGALTRPLAAAAHRVIAIEIDRDLAAGLQAARLPNVDVVEADLLELPTLPVQAPARIAGNLPYNVASPILIRLVDFFESGAPIIDATVMLQREVADRLLAAPGSRDYGTLTVIVTHAADARRLFNLPPGAFRPAPRVESTLVQLRFRPPEVAVPDRERFRWLVQSVFMHRRKTLANALKSAVALSTSELLLRHARIDGTRRPETLSVDEFARLAANL